MVSVATADGGAPAARIGDPDFLLLPEDARRALRARVAWVGRVASSARGTIGLAEAEAAAALAVSVQTVRRWAAGYRASGGDWRSLLDGRLKSPDRQKGLPAPFVEMWRTLCEAENRCCKSAHDKLRAMWSARDPRIAAIAEYAAFPGWPRLPHGWHYRNLTRPRYRPTDFELAACRVGRSAAAAHRPKVIRTRRGLYPGAYFLFDDVWADLEVNVLDTRRRGRPVEFGCLDLYSGCRFAWGTKVRAKNDEGRAEHLDDAQFRFLLAMVLARDGIDADRGTTAVVEHGAAKIDPDIERDLHDATGGKFLVLRGGIGGAPATDCQWRGPSRGNFRVKAPIEVWHRLMHSRSGHLPGQTGSNSRVDEPEQMHGLRRYNDALLVAMGLLPPDRASDLRLPLLEFGQYLRAADAIYAAINGRTDHRLEGWDGLYVPDPVNGGMRRMSPSEVWGSRSLSPAPHAAVAAILFKFCQERTVKGNEIALQDCEISADPLRFDCSGASGGIGVRDGEKVAASVNPFWPHLLYCHDARGRFLGVAPRVHAARWGDVGATHRALGRVAKIEAALLDPIRRRHQAEARRKLAMRRHNARVLDLSRPHTPAERRIAERASAATREDIDAVLASPEPISDPGPAPVSSAPHDDTEDLIDLIL